MRWRTSSGRWVIRSMAVWDSEFACRSLFLFEDLVSMDFFSFFFLLGFFVSSSFCLWYDDERKTWIRVGTVQ